MPVRLFIVIFCAFLLGSLIGLAAFPGVWPSGGVAIPGKSIGTALVGGPFSLTDQHGKRLTDRDFRGRFMLVYFGYTYCPDVCPADLQVLTTAVDNLGPKAKRIAPIFITIDPERDTQQQLASYLQNFHPLLTGLTGSAEEIGNVAKAYRVYYAKVTDKDAGDENYLMNHSAFIYLMDEQGKYVTHFPHGTKPAVITERLAKLL
jgi:protein SCO1/2